MQTSKMIDVNHSKIDFRWSNRLDYKENMKTIAIKVYQNFVSMACNIFCYVWFFPRLDRRLNNVQSVGRHICVALR